MAGNDILAAALSWGRRFAFLALLLLPVSAQADAPSPQDLLDAGLLTLPEPCRISREEFQIAAGENVWVGPVAAGVWVAVVLCEHHAYQATEVVLRIDDRPGGRTSSVLAFPGWREAEATPWPYIAHHPWLVGWSSDVTDGRISLEYKGRGIGDCGEQITYDLTEPVVRIVEYRAKFECDGEWVEPNTWPPVPQRVLDDYAPAFTDRRAAELLSAVVLRWPRADWMGHAIARGDLDGDGRQEQWIGGYSQDWNTGTPSYHLVREQDGDLRSWDFAVATDAQTALCQPAAGLEFEKPDVLAIDDGLCDRLRIGWDVTASTLTMTRN